MWYYRDMFFMVHAGKVLLKIFSRCLKYCEVKKFLPDKQFSLRPRRSTVYIMFVARRLQELGQKQRVPLYNMNVLHRLHEGV